MKMKFILPLITGLTLSIASLASAQLPVVSRDQRKACTTEQTMVLKQLVDAGQVNVAADPTCSPSGATCTNTEMCCGADQCVTGVCTAVSYGGDNCSKWGETCNDSMDCCGGGVCQEGTCR